MGDTSTCGGSSLYSSSFKGHMGTPSSKSLPANSNIMNASSFITTLEQFRSRRIRLFSHVGDDLDRHNGLLAQPAAGACYVRRRCLCCIYEIPPQLNTSKKTKRMTKLLEYSPPQCWRCLASSILCACPWEKARARDLQFSEPGACGALRFFLQSFPGPEMQ